MGENQILILQPDLHDSVGQKLNYFGLHRYWLTHVKTAGLSRQCSRRPPDGGWQAKAPASPAATHEMLLSHSA